MQSNLLVFDVKNKSNHSSLISGPLQASRLQNGKQRLQQKTGFSKKPVMSVVPAIKDIPCYGKLEEFSFIT